MAPSPTHHPAATTSLVARLAGLAGCLGVAAIHVIDQDGIPGTKTPDYVQNLYYLIEIGGVLAAALLLTRYARWGWLLSLGIAAGPLLGYLLSRGPGLPYYHDDIGNWGEPLGIISLLVEALLLILGATSLLPSRHQPDGHSVPMSSGPMSSGPVSARRSVVSEPGHSE